MKSRIMVLLGLLILNVNQLHAADDWTQQSPSSNPPAQDRFGMAYIGGDQVLVFGGWDGVPYDETWMYDLSADS